LSETINSRPRASILAPISVSLITYCLLGDDEYCPSDSLFFMVLLLVGCLRIFMATRVFFNWVVFCSCVEGFSTRGGLFSKIKCFKHILPSRGLLICMSLDSSRLIHNWCKFGWQTWWHQFMRTGLVQGA
jgi:hypothetical protein